MSDNPNPVGRPSEYDPDYVRRARDYIHFETWKTRGRKVPSKEDFAEFLDRPLSTLDNWEEAHPEFMGALERIKRVQKIVLMDGGLGNELNSVITKLMLSSNHDMREKSDVTSDDKQLGSVDAAIAQMEASRKQA